MIFPRPACHSFKLTGRKTIGSCLGNIAPTTLEKEQQFQWVNNWTRTAGNHHLQMGRRHSLRAEPSRRQRHRALRQSRLFLTRVLRGPLAAALVLATFLLGDVSSFLPVCKPDLHRRRTVRNATSSTHRTLSESLQRLTVNYGLRWEILHSTVGHRERERVDGWIWIPVWSMSPATATSTSKAMCEQLYELCASVRHRLSSDFQNRVRMGYGRSFDIGVFGSIFGHTVTKTYRFWSSSRLTLLHSQGVAFNLSKGPPAASFPVRSRPPGNSGFQIR